MPLPPSTIDELDLIVYLTLRVSVELFAKEAKLRFQIVLVALDVLLFLVLADLFILLDQVCPVKISDDVSLSDP